MHKKGRMLAGDRASEKGGEERIETGADEKGEWV